MRSALPPVGSFFVLFSYSVDIIFGVDPQKPHPIRFLERKGVDMAREASNDQLHAALFDEAGPVFWMRRRPCFFGAFCLDVRTLTFCQLMGLPLNH